MEPQLQESQTAKPMATGHPSASGSSFAASRNSSTTPATGCMLHGSVNKNHPGPARLGPIAEFCYGLVAGAPRGIEVWSQFEQQLVRHIDVTTIKIPRGS